MDSEEEKLETDLGSEAERTQRLKQQVTQVVRQLQHGCGKQICFNPDCKTNILSKFSLTKDPREFSND
jgi:hypothetical protein